MSIFGMIDTIRKRPGMYLGSMSITHLFHFLDGYRAAEREYDQYRKKEMFPLDFYYMSEFTNVRLNCHNNAGWCWHILEFCEGDEEKALNKFFELYDEFKQIKMTRYWKAVLSQDNIQWNNSMEHTCRNGKEPVFINPVAVYVIELSISMYILAVETMEDVRLEPQFFTSSEQAKGKSKIPLGAEIYFGKIDSWEEFQDDNIRFDKNIRR